MSGTRIFGKSVAWNFDNFIGFDIYIQNRTTNYTSGIMFHWDGMVIQYLSKRVGLE